MTRTATIALLLSSFLLVSASARAGWEIEQKSYNRRPNGDTIYEKTATLRISKDRVRQTSGKTVAIIDYKNDRYTLLVPARSLFWSGTAGQYLRDLAAIEPNRRRLPDRPHSTMPTEPIKVKPTEITDTIGSYKTTKYEVLSGDEVLQQIWIAPRLNLGTDLDMRALNEYLARVANTLPGKTGAMYAAMRADPEYRKLYDRGFPMRTQAYIGQSVIGQEVVRVSRADVEDSEFAPPSGYLKTSLSSLLDARDALKD